MEKKFVGAPLSAAIWCVGPSWFVQVTAVPAGTVSAAGLKAKFWMVTAAVPPAGAAGADGCVVPAGAGAGDAGTKGGVVGAGAGAFGDEQPANTAAKIRTITDTTSSPDREESGIAVQ